MDVTIPNTPQFLLDEQNVRKGMWGVYHELGHNMQRPMWTMNGTVEVTCNIFSLYGMDVIAGDPLDESPKIDKGIKLVEKYMSSGSDFSTWHKSPWLALTTYIQLAYYFGWDSYKGVFGSYERLPQPKRPKTNQDKLDMWVKMFSVQVGLDLRPFFDLWSWPYSDDITMPTMTLFLPRDAVSFMDGRKVDTIVAKYQGQGQMIRSINNKPPFGNLPVNHEDPVTTEGDASDKNNCQNPISDI